MRDPPVTDANNVPVDKGKHRLGPEANVWGVGAIIYLLMTLKDSEQLDRMIKKRLDYSDPHKPLPKGTMDLLTYGDFGRGAASPTSDDYSDELKDAVIFCTRITPSTRPKYIEIIGVLRKQAGMEAGRLHQEFDGDEQAILENTRLNMTHDDWNLTARGPFWQNFGISLTPNMARPPDTPWLDWFWTEFWKYCDSFAHPDDAKLIPPTACQRVDMGLNYEHKHFLSGVTNNGYQKGVVYYPYQYNQAPYFYHSRTFFPPGGRAIGPRTMLQRLAQSQQEQPNTITSHQGPQLQQRTAASRPQGVAAVASNRHERAATLQQKRERQQRQRQMQQQRAAMPQQQAQQPPLTEGTSLSISNPHLKRELQDMDSDTPRAKRRATGVATPSTTDQGEPRVPRARDNTRPTTFADGSA